MDRDIEQIRLACNMNDQEQDLYSLSSSSHDKLADKVDIKAYAQPFINFITENPTVFHAVSAVGKRLESQYFFERNGSSVIAFAVGKNYDFGNGASVIASHIDALITRLKPIPTLSAKAGYV